LAISSAERRAHFIESRQFTAESNRTMKNQKRTVKFMKKTKGNVQKKAFKKRKRTQSGGAPREAEEEETQPLQFRDAVDSDEDDSGELDGAEYAENDASDDEISERQGTQVSKTHAIDAG
jgi:hypothetical protein